MLASVHHDLQTRESRGSLETRESRGDPGSNPALGKTRGGLELKFPLAGSASPFRVKFSAQAVVISNHFEGGLSENPST